jgi:hypothetical protein
MTGARVLSALLAMTLSGVAFAEPATPQSDLISNPGFEDQNPASAQPAAWTFGTHKGTPKPLIVSEGAHAGKRCVGIETSAQQDTGLWSQVLAPAPGAEMYRLSAFIKTSPGAAATLSASFYSKENKWLGADYHVVQVKDLVQWRRCAGYFRIVPGTATMRVALWGNFGDQAPGTVWFDDVELTTAKEMPAIRYLSPNPPPKPSEADNARGYISFVRNYLDLMPPTYTPSKAEIEGELAAFCSLGEYEPLSIGVYTLRDLKNVSAVPSDLKTESGATIPAGAVAVRSVRLLYKRSHYGMHDRMLVPTFLEAKPIVEAPKGQSRQLWLTIHVPPDAQPGEYRGSVTIHAGGAPDATMPLRLEVLPIRLAEPKGIGLGMYDWPPKDETKEAPCETKFRDMREHGMTMVGLCSNVVGKFDLVDGRGRVAFDGTSGFEKALDAYKGAGFSEPVVWLMGADVKKWALKQGPLESDAFAAAYKGVIESVFAEGKRRDWPETIIQPEDEVFGDPKRFEPCFRCLKLVKEIPGARTEMDGPNTNLERAKLTYPFTDLLVPAYGPLIYGQRVYERQEWREIMAQAHKDQKLIYYYNFDTTGWHPESMRFAFGFYIFATGADGIIEWAYAGSGPSAYDDFKGKTGTTTFFYPKTDDEQGGPSIGWEGVREGVDDFRYVYTLQQLIARCETSEDERVRREATAAKKTLQEIADSVDISRLRTNMSMQGQWEVETCDDAGDLARSCSFKLPIPWRFEDYAAARRRVAERIMAIRQLMR